MICITVVIVSLLCHHLASVVLVLFGLHDELTKPLGQECEFIFIRLNVLREYLERELRMENLPFVYDFEVCFSMGHLSV